MSRDAESVQRRLGERLQALRRARDLTQEDLARRCGISQKFLSELERGEKAASLDTLVALAHRGFELRLAALVFDVDDDAATEARVVEDLLAGRPDPARRMILQGVELLVRAGGFSTVAQAIDSSTAAARAAEPTATATAPKRRR